MIKNVIVQSRGVISASFQPNNPDKGDFGYIFGSPYKSRPFALLSICGHTLDSMGTDNPIENWLFPNEIEDRKKLRKLNCVYMSQICFGDVTEQHNWKPDIFTEEQAVEIINFIQHINTIPEIEDLIVHCDAGISRSGAVAVFACRLLGLDENIVRNKRRISPNPHVLGLLMEKSGLNQKYMREWFEGMPKIDLNDPKYLGINHNKPLDT
jgi:hypothetical protein